MSKPTEMGLSILAGSIGLAFSNIDKISKFEGAGFKAEMWQKMQAIVEKQIEPEAKDNKPLYRKNVSANELKILQSLNDSKYTWRTVSGISSETGISRKSIRAILKELEDKKMVKKTKSTISFIWSPTSLGISQVILASYHAITSRTT